jgi:hypothetical protein
VTEETPPTRHRYRGSGPFREVYPEEAVRKLCACGRHYWGWMGSKAEHCAHCLAAHPELRPQKGIDRSHQA